MEALDLMTHALTTVAADLPIRQAHELMLKMTARHLPVVKGARLIGILSDRDILLRVGRTDDGFVYPNLCVSDLMTPAPLTAGPHTPIPELATLLLEYKIDALPIVTGEATLVGLVTSSDLLRVVAALPYDSKVSVPPRNEPGLQGERATD